jgi:hypothetical protein
MLIMYCPQPSHGVDYKEVRVHNISTIAFRRRNSALNVDNGARESASAVDRARAARETRPNLMAGGGGSMKTNYNTRKTMYRLRARTPGTPDPVCPAGAPRSSSTRC